MKHFLMGCATLFCFHLSAKTLSPTSREVLFRYTAEFITAAKEDAQQAATRHVQHWFGYLQSAQMVAEFGLNPRIQGVGAPAWPAQIRVLDQKESGGLIRIRYELSGRFLLNKLMANKLLRRGQWEAFLPYDLSRYYSPRCTAWPADKMSESEFWYFYDPFFEGCESLVSEPLARAVPIQVESVESWSENLTAPLAELRGDNGNGELFEIVTINGFDESSRNQNDGGRVAFETINDWLEDSLRFTKTEIQRYNNRPIYQFDKDLRTIDGRTIRVRITRLLAETEISARNVTFAKIFRKALEKADVTIFAGHSGADPSLDLKDVERKSGPVQFDRDKLQLFFFDACSSYSHYLPLFDGKKAENRLAVLSFGLTSQFGYESAIHRALLRHLLNMKDDSPRWSDIMEEMERSLRGSTFMLNLYTNSSPD